MINAHTLYLLQKEKEKAKCKIYEKIYELIEKRIVQASSCNFYNIVYEIPEFLIGYPIYSLSDCSDYIQIKLKNNNFNIEFYIPNILIISWNNI